MDDAPAMRGGERRGDLGHQPSDARLGQDATDRVGERGPLDELHHDVRDPALS
jgi:hypothetical protein